MMKKFGLILVCLCIAFSAQAQGIDDLIFKDEPAKEQSSDDNDIIKVNFKKKSAHRALLYSAIFPGAGQFYAKRSALTAYLFPVLEAAMIGGIVYFRSQGYDKEREFEKYANGETITQEFTYVIEGDTLSYTYTGPRYNREFQTVVQNALINYNPSSFDDIYEPSLFRLDRENTQHFYEDIGKYNKYLFGWADWFCRFAMDPRVTYQNPTADSLCVLDEDFFRSAWVMYYGQYHSEFRWVGNREIADYINNYNNLDNCPIVTPSMAAASPMREKYIQMRNDSKDQYKIADYFTFGLVANHIASAIDAVLLTNRVNRTAITQNPLKMYYYTGLRDNKITPSLGFSYSFSEL
jgi:hypothetical protein